MKKLEAVVYLTLFRDFKLASMIKTYRSASCHQVLNSKGLLHPNPLWNSADKLHLMSPFKVHLIRNVCTL